MHPVSAEVRDLERQIIDLAPDPVRRQQLAALQETWLRTRAAQCGAIAREHDRRAVELCVSGTDEDRAQSLRRTKLLLMLEAPAQPAPPQLAQVRVAAALDSGGGIHAMQVTPNGAKALILGVRKLLIVDTLTGSTLRTVPAPNFENAHLSLFPGGRVGVVTDQHVRGMRFWDTETGTQLREFIEAMGPHRILPDARYIAYADVDKLLIYDVVANRAVSAPSSHDKAPLVRIAVSDDGKQIATLTSRGTLTLWRVVISQVDKTFILSRVASVDTRVDNLEARALEFSPSGDSIWTASNAMLTRWILSADRATGTGAETTPARLAAAETVRTGTTQAQKLRRTPGSDVLVLPGSHPQRGSYLLFYDAAKKSAALVDVERNYYPLISLSADGRFLFTSIVHELRRRDIPTPGQFSDADSVLMELSPSAAPSRLATGPILKNLPADLQIEAVGVYEGGGQQVQSVQTSSGLRSARAVTVGVGRTHRPLALVLASYEPVIWDLNIAKNAQLLHVLVSSHYESLVRGAENAQVTRIGMAHTHTFADHGFARLQEQVRQYTGKAVEAYQGAYRGIRFSVGIGAPKEVANANAPQGLAPNFPANLPPTATTHVMGGSTLVQGPAPAGHPDQVGASQAPPDIRTFAEKLYEASAYTSEEAALRTLLDAEMELVASRWLAQKLSASRGQIPVRAPSRWEDMILQLRKALAPVAEMHLGERTSALKASGLDGKTPFLREYERLIQERKSRGNIQFSSGDAPAEETPQTDDIAEILAFHETPAAMKWRKLWPELRAHAAKLAALHYRIDADPGLGPSTDWNERARALVRRTGGRVLAAEEWQALASGRLGFTLSGLDRFLLPLGTEMRHDSHRGTVTTVQQMGTAVVITQREGRGLAFRVLDRRWERDIAKRLSAREMDQIDNALTATYAEKKGRWFAPMELEWDAYVSISRQLRAARETQLVYQSFAERSDAAMAHVWARWQKD